MKSFNHFLLVLGVVTCLLVLAGCAPGGGIRGNNNQQTPAVGTGGFSTSGAHSTGGSSGSTSTTSETGVKIHVFKHTGQTTCEVDGRMLDEFETEMQNLNIAFKIIYETLAGSNIKDGCEYGRGCYVNTGNVVVFEIDQAGQAIAEQAGYRACTYKPEEGVCTPVSSSCGS